MSIQLTDYLIDQDGIDWSASLQSWNWLLPASFTLWMVNRFADLFVVLADGQVHMLDIGAGTLDKVADSRGEFCSLMHLDDNANEWLMIPLVDQLVAAGTLLRPQQCYAFKRLPILGGEYTTANFAPLLISDYLACMGEVHEQMRDLPDGSRVVFKVVPPQGDR